MEAQILAIADAMERWSAIEPGKPRRMLMEWVQLQRRSLKSGARPGAFHPEILTAALALFPQD